MHCAVTITKSAEKELRKVPLHIAIKLEFWVHAVEMYGIEKVRKTPGFHDEPLMGGRKG